MNIIEKYTNSVNSNNLKDDAINHQAEPLAAMAMSDKSGIGTLLWRIKYVNDARGYPRLLEKWTAIVFKKSIKEQWPKTIMPKHIARLSLTQWINDRCKICEGTGKAPHPGNNQVRSDSPCKICNGTAKAPICGYKNQIDYISNCIDVLETEEKMLASKVILKMSKILDI